MNLEECRQQIDRIDRQLVDLLQERLEIAGQVAAYKKEHHLPLFHPEREQQVLEKVTDSLPQENKRSMGLLFEDIMEVSKLYQSRLLPVGKNISPLFCKPVPNDGSSFRRKSSLSGSRGGLFPDRVPYLAEKTGNFFF